MTKQPHRAEDTLAFFKGILKSPKMIGAIAPSGPAPAKAMASAIDLSVPGPILELGPGTGMITRALLEHGVAPERLITLEYNSDFCTRLRETFQNVKTIEGSAFDVLDLWKLYKLERPAYVVSGLPLLNFPSYMRTGLVEDCLSLTHPDGGFIQFTYAGKSSIPSKPESFSAQPIKRVWQNFPPATVWFYKSNPDFVSAYDAFDDERAEVAA